MGTIFDGVSKLGFGFMRLPQLPNGEIDLEQTNTMVDRYMAAGLNYFDTAYAYGDGASENAVKECVVKRYPRDSFKLADKLPVWPDITEEQAKQCFYTSLERTGAEYFDYYLIHMITKDRLKQFEDFGLFDYVGGLKEKGLIKHMGFSFHDCPELLDDVLTRYPEMEFVQLQINYTDWERPSIQSRRCYETARRHGKPIIVMEPIKGGTLAHLPVNVEKIFREADPDVSIASWALRFPASLEGVAVVLSGMSSIEQMENNLSFMKDFVPLSKREQAVVKKAAAALDELDTIPCTSCHYCTKGCPQNIDIPSILADINRARSVGGWLSFKLEYAKHNPPGSRASDCLSCGQCRLACPQGIDIPSHMEAAANIFE